MTDETNPPQLVAHYGEEKATAIVAAVGEVAAWHIAHALDFDAADKREADRRQTALAMARDIPLYDDEFEPQP